MKRICDRKRCTGCGLCVSACPKQCISMKAMHLGHLYPVIDESSCIDCGICVRNCPAINPPSKFFPQKAYAAWSKDQEDYKTSTSGGVASVLSSYIIHNGGVVFGCSCLPNAIIKHIKVDKKEELHRLKGSKYVQSDISEALRLLPSEAKTGRLVLFIGTPCQVASVRNLFRKIPENLFLVDLICHGVPSQDYLRQHIKSILGRTDIDKIVFREQTGDYVVDIQENRKSIYKQSLRSPRYKDNYINAFFDGFTMRKSCHTCQYAKPERASDITIGDFWGLGSQGCCSIPSHPYGISLILPITEKGLSLIEAVKGQLNIFERPIEEAINGNEQLKRPKDGGIRQKIFDHMEPFVGINKAYRFAVLDRIIRYKLNLLK